VDGLQGKEPIMPEVMKQEVAERKVSEKKPPVVIEIDRQFCKGCVICVDVCPKNVLAMADAPDKWEGQVAIVVNLEACTRCMLCEVHCPDFAIVVY